jgi:excisionase family DNA binding protein
MSTNMINFSQYKDYTGRLIHMPSLRELERWMGTGQVAKKLGYSRQGTINLAEEGKIRAVKTGAGWLYDPDSVDMFKARLKASKGG